MLPKEYLVLFQNNMELRASGGFLGSYARIRMRRGVPELLKIEDIYTPDGQLEGHVDPPWPIQAAFGQGWWKLRDSNWDPDFPTAAKNMTWFFEQGKEPKVDGIIAINLSFLEKLLKITGPVYVVDEPEKITADNFYKKTQAAVENGFFPGSVQKKAFMSKLGTSVFENVLHMSLWKKVKLPFIVLGLLHEKQILVYSTDSTTQAWLARQNYDGHLATITSKQDYFSFFENNLGANKANCCIQRQVTLHITGKDKGISHILTLHYDNTNPTMLKQPPQYWGGAYVNFVRVGLPLDARITSLKVGNTSYPIPSEGKESNNDTLVNLMKQETDEQLRSLVVNDDPTHIRVDIEHREDIGIKLVGFFVVVDALGSNDIVLEYNIPRLASELVVQKQSGISSYPLTVQMGDDKKKVEIASDTVLRYAQ